MAEKDAEILLQKKPTFIVWQITPEYVWEVHENIFREGKRSGQRKLKLAYNKLTISGEYEYLGTYKIGDSFPIKIWHKTNN